ncbi:DeoR/GlpR family DNA-binding transcription regulator [Solicola sp. PLA-1-18]|uniref:DeoR/GlpR family DNA-binding transcription regulator n=1 Tax=Solicola sp. PLA-1-18 TaxID=3380532 RepID=UPI003B82A1C8
MTDVIEPSRETEQVRLSARERHDAIVGYLGSEGRVEATDLATRLDVAVETVRRDLRLLEGRGALQRAHGGAVPVSPLERPARPVADAASTSLGAAAVRFMPARGSALIGQGQHCLALASAVVEDKRRWDGLRLATTSVEVAVLLSRREDLVVHNLGGTVGSDFAQHGQWTLDELDRINVDVAFLAPSGVDVEGGLTLEDGRDGAVASAVLASARRLVVMADAAAVGAVGFWRFGTLGDVDVLVADAGSSEHALAAMEELDLTLERVRG